VPSRFSDEELIRTLALETVKSRLRTHLKCVRLTEQWFLSLRSLGLALTLLNEEQWEILLLEESTKPLVKKPQPTKPDLGEPVSCSFHDLGEFE